MANLKLDENDDLAFEGTNLNMVIIDGIEAIVQDCENRLKTYLNEFFLDTRIGTPYQKILGRKYGENITKSIIRKSIMTTPGIINVFDLKTSFNVATRLLKLSFRGDTIEGPFTYNKELII